MDSCQQCFAASQLYTYQIPNIQNHLRADICNLSPSRISEVEDTLQRSQADLVKYEAEILYLETNVVLLKTRMDLLKEHIERTRSLLAPIRKLPDELLAQVFMYCCCYDYNTSKRAPSNAFMAVCSRWRRVAQSHPDVWSSIRLIIHSDTGPGFGDCISKALSLQIHRTQSCPLNLRLWFNPGPLSPYAKNLLDIILTQITRCKYLEIHFSDPHRADDFPVIGCLTVLESLVVHEASTLEVLPTIFTSLPKLRMLSAPTQFFNRTDSFIPWDQVTSLCIKFRNVFSHDPTLLANIQQCAGLSVLEYGDTHYYQLPRQSQEPTPHIVAQPSSSVQTLILSLNQEGHGDVKEKLWEALLASLTLPMLNTIILRPSTIFDGSKNRSLHALGTFIHRSGCRLTTLAIEKFNVSDTQVLSLLEDLPTLVNLSIHELPNTVFISKATKIPIPIVTQKFLQCLHSYGFGIYRNSSSPLLPKLQQLSLGVHGTWFNEELFVGMVISRWFPCRSIDVTQGSVDGTPDIAPNIESLKRVHVRVSTRRVDKTIWNRLKCVEAGFGRSKSGGIIVCLEDEGPESSDDESETTDEEE